MPPLDRSKPLTEMTPDELREFHRQLRRQLTELDRPAREHRLRAGLAKPRTAAEWAIFAADWHRSDPEADGSEHDN
jgi:hypothetical protein